MLSRLKLIPPGICLLSLLLLSLEPHGGASQPAPPSGPGQELGPEDGERVVDELAGIDMPRGEFKAMLARTRLASPLAKLNFVYETRGIAAALALSFRLGLEFGMDGTIAAVVELDPKSAADWERVVAELGEVLFRFGGSVEHRFEDLVFVRIPVHLLRVIAEFDGVRRVREPAPALPLVSSEGLGRIGAADWHRSEINGAGVKIGIIDAGFDGVEELRGNELPDDLVLLEPDFARSDHGTAVAEIIHDVAPGAKLFLAPAFDDKTLCKAIDKLIEQKVDVVNMSLGFSITQGPLDGTGKINSMIARAVEAGIVWVNSAGNHALANWIGEFSDSDGDRWLDFAPGDEINNLMVVDTQVRVDMVWNDPWGGSANDYDLAIFRILPDGRTEQVASSETIQDGDDDPVESCFFVPRLGAAYGVAVQRFRGEKRKVHINVFTQEPLEFRVASSSILVPADNRDAIAIGASRWKRWGKIEEYSSQGPTSDGRIKPDLVGPDCISTAALGPSGFCGTSAASPHVAGAAALVIAAGAARGPKLVKAFLEMRAKDKGSAGKDNIFGAGLLNLKPAPRGEVEELVFFDDMENGTSGWTQINPPWWGLTRSSSSSQMNSWTDSPDGLYPDNANISLASPAIDLRGFKKARLSFWHRYDLESDGDFGQVWATSDRGGSLTFLTRFTGRAARWREANVDLSALAGKPEVKIYFQLVSNGGNRRDGWYLDDVEVSAVREPIRQNDQRASP